MEKHRQAKEIFDKLDINNDGAIGKLEFKAGLVQLGFNPPESLVDHMVKNSMINYKFVFFYSKTIFFN